MFDKALTLEASVNARDRIGGHHQNKLKQPLLIAHSRLEQLYA